MSNPKLFGNTIDTLMIPQKELQSVVYDLLILRTERPKGRVIAPQALHQVLQTSPDDDPEGDHPEGTAILWRPVAGNATKYGGIDRS